MENWRDSPIFTLKRCFEKPGLSKFRCGGDPRICSHISEPQLLRTDAFTWLKNSISPTLKKLLIPIQIRLSSKRQIFRYPEISVTRKKNTIFGEGYSFYRKV